MVALDARGVSIEGEYQVLLCSSVFYFRIPEGFWDDRIRKVKAAGYNTIDVYFPWNWHETRRDVWDFETGMRNVRSFLALAARRGVYVVARPGPYICSEWDGGSLPAYLVGEGVPVRQNHPAFLDRVREWYRRILPIIAEYEVGRSGTVILLQIENELDFYDDCADPRGYLEALRDMARESEITVPLFACAGQGDLEGAWAGVEGVVPTLNLYLDPRMPEMDGAIAPYVSHLGELGHPLLVTETGRDVLLLRRLLANGAKLLGAYNQVAGFDFGFTNSINNWGTPLSFQTSYYCFDSLVDSFGRVSPTAGEHRALADLTRALGGVLAAARPCTGHGIEVTLDGVTTVCPVLALGIDGAGGYALAVSNTTEAPVQVTFRRGGDVLPRGAPLIVPPGVSCFVFFDLSLAPWGIPGRLLFSAAEPTEITGGAAPRMRFQTLGDAEIHYDPGNGAVVATVGPSTPRGLTVADANGGKVVLRGTPRLAVPPTVPRTAAGKPGRRAIRWSLSEVAQTDLFPAPVTLPEGESPAMERHGALRGYALYRTTLSRADLSAACGVLLHDAADIVSLYLDGRYLGTRVPGGAHTWFELPRPSARAVGPAILEVRAEIWGHSNFHDPRLPAIGMTALRGISGATLVSRKDPMPVWRMKPGGRDGPAPYLSSAGGRLTGTTPPEYTSTREITPATGTDTWHLWIEGAECVTPVEVDGRAAGWIDALHPFLALTTLSPARTSRLVLTPRKWYGAENVGRIWLLQGRALRVWRLAAMDEPELAAAAAAARGSAAAATVPLSLKAGRMAWLHAALPEGKGTGSLGLTLRGRNLKATVVFNGRITGRLFLDTPRRPKMAGGRDDLAYLPACWMRRGGNTLALLLEAVGPGAGRLESVDAETVD